MSDLLERLMGALLRLADGAVLAGGRRLQAGDARAEFGYVVRAGLEGIGGRGCPGNEPRGTLGQAVPSALHAGPAPGPEPSEAEVQDEGASLRVLVYLRGGEDRRGGGLGGGGPMVRVEGGHLVVERGSAGALRIPLPAAVRPETLSWSARCGVLEAVLEKAVGPAGGAAHGGPAGAGGPSTAGGGGPTR
ncbi:MAG: hypothetical protein K6T75_04075 [Acetobacteraceae bacterium]|nr:hypothetical protein [Acetobacteraceae bacterium]